MSLTENTTQVADSLKLLIQQFKNKPYLASLLSSYMEQVQLLETALFLMQDARLLSNAEGEQLDGIGRIVGLQRNGAGDADYLMLLGVKILANRSKATIPDFETMYAILSTKVHIWKTFAEGYAEFELEIVDEIADDSSELQWIEKFLKLMRAAGVRCIVSYPNGTIASRWFSFGPSDDPEGDAFGFPLAGIGGGKFIRGDET